ncbi:MAG TPA: polyphosphate kinase 1 [Accumulibacter sp.]|nr:polyphosphate kinase 1 [Accumulibacter sp.]HMW17473.1 polyphosphate kinase 1 [Accumulibacter sp.]HMX21700.1 polyphosphate kinase 1 [Accumulibacter sp.]HNC17781.1 polyphosphate kinase 1 [Accumulibacter sp.]HND80021.1 polyphosphate kinase 1 [Accumulibacter sp.]
MTTDSQTSETPTVHSPSGFPADYFQNREMGLLGFNKRVLYQAKNPRTPLLERLRFLCIVSSNLDEFFEIRVAGIKEQLKLGSVAITTDGKTAREVYQLVSDETHALVKEQYSLLNDEILPAMAKESIHFDKRLDWNPAQREWIRDFFFREVMPVITPIGLDPSHPFPRVLNKSLNFAVELEGRDAFGRSSGAAIVQAPRVLPRVIRLPRELGSSEYTFVFLSSILHEFVHELFAGMKVLGCYQFRVTRNSDLFVDEEEVKNLRTKIQGELPQRNFGDAVRLEVADNCSDAMIEFLLGQFNLSESDLYRVAGPVNLARLMQVPDWVLRNDLKFQPFNPGLPKALHKCHSVFDAIRGGDILLHHPYQSFTPVIDLLEQSALDPQVVAIKMTVYRTGTDSVLMQSLLRAAQNGKEVTVVVELMARFDEEANIGWATRLEEVGAHVVYGVVGYKTHAKMLMVVRREEGKSGSILRRYVHLGTGNYHPKTARIYSDFGLLTCNEDIGNDTNEVFKQLTGLGLAQTLTHLWQAPFSLQANVVAGIRAEAEAARAGKRSRIIAKMNSLLEPETIAALYDASQAGVKIDMIVRGVCGLRAGVKGLSENITVRSIIGRQLEHHRVFYFHAGGEEKVYLSSADWMERNFFRRIELAFPVLDRKLKRRVIAEGLQIYLNDNQQAWELNPDGSYHLRRGSRTSPHSAQAELIEQLKA